MYLVVMHYGKRIGREYVWQAPVYLGVFEDSQIAWQSVGISAEGSYLESDYPDYRTYRRPESGDLVSYSIESVPHYTQATGF